MQRGERIVALAVAVATSLTLLMSGQAHAASNGLGVNPRRNYTINPGESKSDTLVVTNLNKTEDLFVSVQTIDFQASNQSGAPELLLTEKNPTRWSIKPFIKIADTYTIKAGQSANIPFTISIPKNQGGGSYYSAIRYSASGGGNNSNLNLSSASSTLMFVTVPGAANESLVMKDFGPFVPDAEFVNGAYQKVFGASQPKYMSYTLQNEGNVVEQPKGSIQIKNMFGKQVQLIENINPNRELVILNQTRRIDVCIKAPDNANLTNTENSNEEIAKCKNPSLLPGRYTATAGILYGDIGKGNKEIKAVATFWYLPAWFLIIVALVCVVIIGLIWLVLRKVKSGRSYRSNR